MDFDPGELQEEDTRVDEVIAEYLKAVESGQDLDRTQWLERYPDLAGDLAEFFQDRDRVEGWARPYREWVAPDPVFGFCPHCQSRLETAGGTAPCPKCGSRDHLESGTSPLAGTRRLGRYELRAVVGRGAFGMVHRAWDPELKRDVAVKVPRPGILGTADDLERFLREARSAAQLNHPNIVPVYDCGQADGVPYLVSKYVPGKTLADLLREHHPAWDWSARLLETIADALEHAHERQVIHRDLKPSNILVGEGDSPAVTDFGLALRTGDDPTLTLDGEVLGTAAYMSPEQAEGKSHRVDGRSDVYSLGVILYQLLVGEVPFRGAVKMVLSQILHEEPPPPRRLNDRVPRDLETVCLKCLEKEPARRYARARDLAEDLRRYQQGKPVLAKPVGRLGRLARWRRRNPALAAATGLAAALLVAVTAVSCAWALHAHWLAGEVQVALGESERQRLQAQERLAERYFDQALVEHGNGETGLGLLWMARSLETTPPGAQDLAASLRESLAGWRCQLPCLTGCHAGAAEVLAFDPDGGTVWTTDPEGALARRSVATGKPVGPSLPHTGRVTAVAASADGRVVATAVGREAHLWDVASGKRLQTFRTPGRLDVLALSHDSKTVVTADRPEKGGGFDTTLRCWDVPSGTQLAPACAHDGRVGALAVHPDGHTLLAALVQEGGIKSWVRVSHFFKRRNLINHIQLR